jgi:hypothetical protein
MMSRAEALAAARAEVPYFQQQWEANPNWYTEARLHQAKRTLELMGETAMTEQGK